eukprot:IDg3250t1
MPGIFNNNRKRHQQSLKRFEKAFDISVKLLSKSDELTRNTDFRGKSELCRALTAYKKGFPKQLLIGQVEQKRKLCYQEIIEILIESR